MDFRPDSSFRTWDRFSRMTDTARAWSDFREREDPNGCLTTLGRGATDVGRVAPAFSAPVACRISVRLVARTGGLCVPTWDLAPEACAFPDGTWRRPSADFCSPALSDNHMSRTSPEGPDASCLPDLRALPVLCSRDLGVSAGDYSRRTIIGSR